MLEYSKRVRRPRWHYRLTLSVFFIAYTVFQVVLGKPSAELRDIGEHVDDKVSLVPRTRSTRVDVNKEEQVPMNEGKETGKQTDGNEVIKGMIDEEDEVENKKLKDAGYEEGKATVETREEEKEEKAAIPTARPPRTCTPPAIEQFPRPPMGKSARRHGGLVLHILVAVFTFIGLAVVCDEYFVSSLARICEELHLAPDVAGATFMAAGSSAPELATVIVGVFYAQDDIGVSGVLGSSMFNLTFVISACALCAGAVSHLTWWPLCRDSFFYAVSILVMVCIIADGYVSWPEALFMLIMYGVYCVALRFNTTLERWLLTLLLPFKLPSREKQAAPVPYTNGGQVQAAATAEGQYAQEDGNKDAPQQPTEYKADGICDNVGHNAEPTNVWNPDRARNETSLAAVPKPTPSAYYLSKQYNPETAVDPLVKPIGANRLQLACWCVTYPVHWCCRRTMPDCRGPWYPVTFIISILWISFYSYFMVWMITIIGHTIGVPDAVMSLTFVAAGASVPDALVSLAVIKQGYGDMAVSNAVGSNVLDILVRLGLPWFIQTAIIWPGTHVNVISKGLIYSTLALLSPLLFLVMATLANGWKLDRKYGALLMVWSMFFITLASLYELNVFGSYHPPDCESGF